MKRNYEAENEIDMTFRLAVEFPDSSYFAGKLTGLVNMAFLCDLITDEEYDFILNAYRDLLI